MRWIPEFRPLPVVAALSTLASTLVSTPKLSAQAPDSVAAAAETIVEEDLAQHVDQLMVDSLQDRVTPSDALDRTAALITEQLQQLGLQAGFRHWNWRVGNEDTSWVLRYPVPGQCRLDYAATNLTFIAGVTAGDQPVVDERGTPLTREVTASFARAAHFATEAGPPIVAQSSFDLMLGEEAAAGSQRAVLVAGAQQADSLASMLASLNLDKRVAIYVPPAGVDTAVEHAILRQLYAGSRGVVVVHDKHPITFAAAVAAWRRNSLPVVDGYLRAATRGNRWPWAIEVRPDAVAGVLAGVGADLAQLRKAKAPVVRELNGLQVWLRTAVDSTVPAAPVTAPIVAALIKGTDSLLAGEYVILVTHMDTPATADTSAAARAMAARTQGVNVAGLLSLARAFRDPAVRLRRSVLLLVTSGEAGTSVAWGGNFLIQEAIQGNFDVGGLQSIMVTFDVGSWGGGDSLVIDGRSLLELSQPPAFVAAAHPELGVTIVDKGTPAPPGAAAAAFVRNYLPGIALHLPAADTLSAEALAPVEGERAVRLFRYLFYLGYELANAEKSPQWSEEGRRALLQLHGR